MRRMTNEEAIEVLDDMKVKVEIPKAAVTQYKKNVALDMAIEALEAQDVARERYEDLCEYFNNNPHTIELILNDRKEFKAWLERVHWHVLECDKLARKLEALEGKDTDVPSNVPDTNVGDTISRQDVLGWLLAYHTKSFELKGRYYPHEVIGWLVADISKNLFADMRGEQE